MPQQSNQNKKRQWDLAHRLKYRKIEGKNSKKPGKEKRR